MIDSDLHWSNSMEIDREALNLWSASEIRCLLFNILFMPKLQRMLFGMLGTERIFATERTSSSCIESLYEALVQRSDFLIV